MVELFSVGIAWRHFADLEGNMIEALDFVPLRRKHDAVWSHKFGKLLEQTGSAVASFFEVILGEGRLFNGDRPGPNAKLTIANYREKVEPVYRLAAAEVVASDGVAPYDRLMPFEGFDSGQSPSWWEAYNRYKHYRYSEAESATLRNTVEALAGLFLLNILHKENQEYLTEHGVIRGLVGSTPKRVRLSIEESKFGTKSEARIEARSELFTHRLRPDVRSLEELM